MLDFIKFSVWFLLVVFGLSETDGRQSVSEHGANSNLRLAEEFANILRWDPPAQTIDHQSTWFSQHVSTAVLNNISKRVSKNEVFVNRNRGHLKAAELVMDILMAQESVEDVLTFALALRDHPQINPKLWLHALITTKLMRQDMQFLPMPALVEILPDDFIPNEIFELAKLASNQEEECILLDETFGADNSAENGLWYFREDMMMNSHHWFWHVYFSPLGLILPGEPIPEEPDRIDRRAELFSFMHHEFLARYGTDRMAVGLPRFEAVTFEYETLLEPYTSHLTDANSGLNWTDRAPNTKLSDIGRQFNEEDVPGGWVNITVNATAAIQELLLSDIRSGALVDVDGTPVPLDGFTGIEIVGDTTESSHWGLNPKRYFPGAFAGGFHNDGHALIAYSTSPLPDPEIPQIPGVMASTATSLRDPVFYRLHTAIENVFLEHKNTLTPYTPSEGEFPLKLEGVRVTNVKVTSENEALPQNNLQTFWNHKEYDFPNGLDLGRNTSLPAISICSKHLDHDEFDFEITLENEFEIPKNSTIRIFLARRYDENLNRFTMLDQRTRFFSLDQFPVTLTAGTNTIVRNSRNSSLTIPFESWRSLNESSTLLQNCGCGLPHHLLLPKGTPTGTTFDLFVMATESNAESETTENFNPEEGCHIAPLWCGIRGKKYPSLYPLGYPFDRLPYSVEGESTVVENLDEYVAGVPNSNAIQIRIQHLESGL